MSKPKTVKKYDAVSEAKLRFGHMSARKARYVADLIRGKRVGEALMLLQMTYKPSAAPEVLAVLKSAKANAERKNVSDVNDLVVRDIFVDSAPIQYRTRPAPQGRGVKIRKRKCHITIRLNFA